jgi:HD superfamily phosphohydrolase
MDTNADPSSESTATAPSASTRATSIQALPANTVINDRYQIKRWIGGGGAGVVYEVEQLGIRVPRALKFVLRDEHAFLATFQQEIQLHAAVTHRNIIKILDVGEFSLASTKTTHPFYVMDLVPSGDSGHPPTLDMLFAAETRKRVLIDALIQVLDGLAYLHAHGILHFDIKPVNILYQIVGDDALEIKIGDLGIAKMLCMDQVKSRLVSPTPNLPDMTMIYCTPRYVPQYVRTIRDTGAPLPRELLRDFMPHVDLFCFGLTLVELVSTQVLPKTGEALDLDNMLASIKPNISRSLSAPDLSVLLRIIRRLVTPDPRDPKCYSSAEAVRQDITKLKAEYLQPLGVPEFALGGLTKSINLANEKAWISDRIYRLVNHPMFQRLQYQNQLNLVHLVFAEGRHSRLTHSLHMYRNVHRYVSSLVGDAFFRYLLNAGDYALLSTAALLHDVGHYPLAHAMDDIAARSGSSVRSHVETTDVFLRDRLNDTGESLADILASPEWCIDVEALMRVIGLDAPQSEAEHLMKSIIDGPIDADKLSYLEQDSSHTGVRYGLGMDVPGFLAGLVAVPPEDAPKEAPTDGMPSDGQIVLRHAQIGISEKGIAPAESIIGARYHMYDRVYWHHTNRAIMTVIKHNAELVFQGGHYSFDEYLKETKYSTDYEALRILAREYAKVDPTHQHNPIEGLLDGRRDVYRRLVSIPGDQKHPYAKVYSRLAREEPAELEDVRRAITTTVASVGSLHDLCNVCGVLIDIPKIDPEQDTLRPVYVRSGVVGSHFSLLHEKSRVVEALGANFQSLVKKCRFFIPRKVRDKLRDEGLMNKVERAVLEKLNEWATNPRRSPRASQSDKG